MKTLKFALIAAIVACTMVSLAYADGFKEKPKPLKVLNVTIQKAIHIPGLLVAMYEQLDKEDFLNNPQLVYVGKVNFKGVQYRISGTREQWIKFFQLEGVSPVNTNKVVFGIG